jgi:hypothetical protein
MDAFRRGNVEFRVRDFVVFVCSCQTEVTAFSRGRDEMDGPDVLIGEESLANCSADASILEGCCQFMTSRVSHGKVCDLQRR